MHTLSFEFNERRQDYKHIVKVEYYNVAGKVVVEESEILSHDFPLDEDMHLFAENKSYKVSCKNLRLIEITKE